MAFYRDKRVLITAGPTWEMLDPVRFLSNRSSGQLGYALARIARQRGAQVTLVSGPTALQPPTGVEHQPIVSAREMHDAALLSAQTADIIIMAAAVADYRPRHTKRHKIKKQPGATEYPVIELEPNPDILAALCRQRHPGQFIVGFALESQELLRNARQKLQTKGCDLLIANEAPAIGAALHQATILTPDGATMSLQAMPKPALARRILSSIATHYGA